MGWKLSLYIAQAAHEHLAIRNGLDLSSGIMDKATPPILSKNNVAHAQYVDNYLCASRNRQYVRSDANAHQAGLEKANMPCHDLEDGVSFAKFAGLELDGVALTARVSWRRIWILYFGITYVLTLSELSGAQLECMLGHITWAMLVRRE